MWPVFRLALTEIKEELKTLNKPRKLFFVKTSKDSLAARFARIGECPACDVAKRSQAFNLKLLVSNLDNEDFRNRYKDSEGLCFPHFVMALELAADNRCLAILVDDQVSRLEKLITNLTTYIDKHDYRNNEPYTADEERAVAAAIRMAVGTAPLLS
ncbi:DUF6062 family protein [Syntrophothermus sp.]|uniref:DUF6062 family protein n=1 Tax=Syntrophothermus sp. TaxID=2736299 RepID=UPI00338EFC5D